jgi:DNA-binding CsgD family transcriptional regulator
VKKNSGVFKAQRSNSGMNAALERIALLPEFSVLRRKLFRYALSSPETKKLDLPYEQNDGELVELERLFTSLASACNCDQSGMIEQQKRPQIIYHQELSSESGSIVSKLSSRVENQAVRKNKLTATHSKIQPPDMEANSTENAISASRSELGTPSRPVLSMSEASNQDFTDLLQAREFEHLMSIASPMLDKLNVDSFILEFSPSEKILAPYNQLYGSFPDPVMEQFGVLRNRSRDRITEHVSKSSIPVQWEIELLREEDTPLPYRLLKANGVLSGVSFGVRGDQSLTRVDYHSHNPNLRRQPKTMHSELFLITSYLTEAAKAIWAARNQNHGQSFTHREAECLSWSARGKTAPEIGIILGISRHTVYFHLKKVASKLNVFGTHHAISRAMELGLIKAS